MSFASVFSRLLPVSRGRGSVCTLLLGSALLLPGALRAQFAGNFEANLGPELDDSTVFTVIVANVPRKIGSTKIVERILAGGDLFALSELDSTGSLLPSFINPTIGGDNRVIYTIVPAQPGTYTDASNPLFYIGGLFGKTQVNKTKLPAQNVQRLSLAGVIDSSFDTGTGADDGYVTAIVPLNDTGVNSLVVGGLYTTFNKQAYPHVVRLTSTGAISPGFAPVPVNDNVFAAAAQIDPALGTADPVAPQFLIGGTFTAIGNTDYTKLARINYDGSVDASFKPVIDERVLAIATQPDGKIIVGGQFAVVNGQPVGHLARLNQDGSLDTTFAASVGVIPQDTSAPVAVYAINLLPDGRFYVGGNFYAANGVTRRYLARFNTDGSLDENFDPGVAITNSVQTIAVQQDNQVIVGETVNKKVNNVFPPTLIRLYGDLTTIDAAVTVTATKPDARTGDSTARKNGLVTFTRSGASNAAPLTFYFMATGTAQQGSAFHALKATNVSGNLYRATFPAGQDTFQLRVKTLGTVLADSPESLTFTVEPSPDASALYNTGSGVPTAATVKIRNP